MNRFEDVFRPFLQGNAAQQLMRAPIHHIDAKREKRQITVELHPEQRIPMEEITRVEKQIMQTANLALFEVMTATARNCSAASRWRIFCTSCANGDTLPTASLRAEGRNWRTGR